MLSYTVIHSQVKVSERKEANIFNRKYIREPVFFLNVCIYKSSVSNQELNCFDLNGIDQSFPALIQEN